MGVGVRVGIGLRGLHLGLLAIHLGEHLSADLRPRALREGLGCVLGVGLGEDVRVRVRTRVGGGG